jgi:hypothetical protein
MPQWGWRNRFDPEGAFWSKVDKSDGPNACWPWLAAEDRNGYGAVRWGGKKVNTHRVALELKLGRPIADGMLACHTRNCTTRLCCNPTHLYEGTRSQNVQDALATGTHVGSKGNENLAHRHERMEGPPGMAWCMGCQDFLPVAMFSRNIARWNGLNKYCKDCKRRMR